MVFLTCANNREIHTVAEPRDVDFLQLWLKVNAGEGGIIKVTSYIHLDPWGLDVCALIGLQAESFLMIRQGLSENRLQLSTRNIDVLGEIDMSPLCEQ